MTSKLALNLFKVSSAFFWPCLNIILLNREKRTVKTDSVDWKKKMYLLPVKGSPSSAPLLHCNSWKLGSLCGNYIKPDVVFTQCVCSRIIYFFENRKITLQNV